MECFRVQTPLLDRSASTEPNPKRQRVGPLLHQPATLEFKTGRDLQFITDTYLPKKADTSEDERARLKIIMTESEVMRVVDHLAALLNAKYANNKEPILMVGILNGVCFFFSYLMQRLDIAYEICFVKVETYGASQVQNQQTTEVLMLDKKRMTPGRQVLLLDELEDNGKTMNLVRDKLLQEGIREADLTTCVLFSKAKDTGYRRSDITGIICPDLWLIGWGLDHKRSKRGWSHLFAICKDEGVPLNDDDEVFTADNSPAFERIRTKLIKQLEKM
eukprot:NODE_1416_length_929_cov_265.229545_g1093_i0.p1 GENE.NODE_1416_length_929_cov_265.229545_g1093_i0~~NODE_1416_length_929_cov_265.229545_g1093_i0.p1  ORF type:complete len:293 (+),score=76.96 NODE_1416_length_929_cov_265.229545_g1093_i0:56-880(+)